MKRVIFAFLVAALAAAVVLPASAGDEERYKAVMDKIVSHLNNGVYENVYAMFNEPAAAKTPKDQALAGFKAIMEKFGKIVKTGPPQMLSVNDATFVLYFEKGIVDIRIALDSGDHIAGLAFAARPPADKVPDRQATPLRLPFAGAWFTLQGGDSPTQNHHVSGHPSQRYACDFIAHDADGLAYKSLGKKNEDYFAFGRKVLSPAAGEVAEVINGVRDNKPGVANPFVAMGNCVIIKHRAGEYSLLAHLKYGSITVKPGDKVKVGQAVGQCGNSGSAMEPQLHFSMMNSASLIDATGIKVCFAQVKVTRGGATKTQKGYSPVKDDIVGQ